MSPVTPERLAEAAARIKAAPYGRWTPAFERAADELLRDPQTQAFAERELREIWRQIDPHGSVPTHQRERIFANAKEKARANGANGRDSSTTNTTGSVPFIITSTMKQRLRGLGHADDEIREMTPAQAWALLSPAETEGGTNRPSRHHSVDDHPIIPPERRDTLRIFDWKNEANGGGEHEQEKPKADEAHTNTTGTADAGTAGPAAVSAGAQPKTRQDPPQPPLRFQWINMSKWDDELRPEREWSVLNRIPQRQVALFSGEGGAGKSYVTQHLCAAHVLGRDWLGTLPAPGPAFFIEAEDDEKELHRRLGAICDYYEVKFSDLVKGGLYLKSLAGEEAMLAVASRSGKIETTPFYKQLLEEAGDIKPAMMGIASSANVFAGNENDRTHVQQFASLLTRLAIVADGSVVLVSHPSLTGINSDTGLSGTTQWHNAFRARFYMKGIKSESGEQPSDDLREIVFKKNQYGPKAETIVLRYQRGMFLPIQGVSSLEKLRSDADADEAFLKCLDELAKQGRRVGVNTGTNYAPARFAETTLGKTIGNAGLKAAMARLFDSGKIIVGKNPDVRPGKATQVILRKPPDVETQ
jgi:RecA-family ATPase